MATGLTTREGAAVGRGVRAVLMLGLLLLGVVGLSPAAPGGPVSAAPPFGDVSPSDPAYAAINELASRGIIRGCDPEAGRFCPADPIARAMGWDEEDHENQFGFHALASLAIRRWPA
jgi:hypothetical protein